MSEIKPLSKQTRHNWQIDAGLFLTAVLASLSGIYFLFLPNGYQGGRNPLYGITILFNRETWDLIHTWTGVGMIAVAILHIAIHWKWITGMAKRMWREITCQCTPMNGYARFNVAINALVALGFLLAAISGVYLLFFPGGRYGVVDPMILFNRTVWDLVHTWSGVVMIAAAVIHFAIHWKWVTKVTRRYFAPSGKASVVGSAGRSMREASGLSE